MQGLRMGCEGAGDDRQSGVPVNMYFKEEEELKMSNLRTCQGRQRTNRGICCPEAAGNLSNSSFQDMVETNT